MSDWLNIATRRDVVVRSLKVGTIVGTILTAINQGDLILAGALGAENAWKIPLTYLVPYCVSTYAGVSAIITRHDQENDL
jgi:hypothetical protein